MRTPRIALGLIAAGLVSFVAACNLPGHRTNPFAHSDGAKPATYAYDGPPVTVLDKPALLQDAGPMDGDVQQQTFSETNTGLRYRILRRSNGRKPTASSTVTVDYRGWLDDGTEFDSSYKRGKPFSSALTNVVPGWSEGMQLIGTGGMIELWIPSVLGYGTRGAGADVPPNSTLHFIVELHDVM